MSGNTETQDSSGTGRPIARTGENTRHPWPADAFLQGGKTGLVLRRDGSAYTTAFVEAFVDNSFIRGEGDTVTEAESHAWAQYETFTACATTEPGHSYETRGYTNGAGFCAKCGHFRPNVFTAEELGQHCVTCGTATMWSRAGNDWYCQDHQLDVETRSAKHAEDGYAPGLLETLLDRWGKEPTDT